jgi:hypothetical protein
MDGFKGKLKASVRFRLRHRFLLWRLKEHAAKKAAEVDVQKSRAPAPRSRSRFAIVE